MTANLDRSIHTVIMLSNYHTVVPQFIHSYNAVAKADIYFAIKVIIGNIYFIELYILKEFIYTTFSRLTVLGALLFIKSH